VIERDLVTMRADVPEPAEPDGPLPTPAAGPAERTTVDRSIDLLMVTNNRPAFARRALERLLATCDDEMRVWLWHNGDREDSLDVFRSFVDHPRVYRFHHSIKNTGRNGLWQPMNWVLAEGSGAYFSNVDDDCLMPDGWADVLRSAHEDVPMFGVLGCWRFRPEDFRPAIARPRIGEFAGGHRILRNCWIERSGFLMKRACAESAGLLRPGMGFSNYCVHLAASGWIHGWYYPFLYQEHMDDPRSPFWLPQLEGRSYRPGRRTAAVSPRAQQERVRVIRARAFYVQRASLDSRRHIGWRAQLRRPRFAVTRLLRLRPLRSPRR
jgi:glycosyl transferase family 2